MYYAIKVETALRFKEDAIERLAQTPVNVLTSLTLLDGFSTVHPLAEFANALRNNPGMRKLQFAPAPKSVRDVATNAIAVFLPGDEYVLGYIGTSSNSKGQRVYMVCARGIRNDKYNTNNDKYHSQVSTNMDKAIKTAKTHLRSYSPIEAVNMDMYNVTEKVRSAKGNASGTIMSARYDVVSQSGAADAVLDELVHMYNSGYQFVDLKLKERVGTYINAKAEHEAQANSAVHMYAVKVRVVDGVQKCTVTTIMDAHNRRQVSNDALVETMDMSDLPENIAGGIAVLTMAERGTYIPGVGIRTSETAFFVERSW